MNSNNTIEAKPYAIVLLVVAIISTLIVAVTPFISVISVEILGITETESGMDYLFNKDTRESETVYDEKLDIFVEENEHLITEKTPQIFIKLLVAVAFIFVVVGAIICFRFYSSGFSLHNSLSILFILNLIYSVLYFVLFFIISKSDEVKNLDMIKIGENLYAPTIFQVICFVVGKFANNLYLKALSGNAPYTIFNSGNGVKNANKTDVSIESEKIDLLLKYKKLYDNGVITEEEFKEKKDLLLNYRNDDVDGNAFDFECVEIEKLYSLKLISEEEKQELLNSKLKKRNKE